MSLNQKFSKLSARGRNWWVFSAVIFLFLTVGIVVAGESYNNFSRFLATKTNDIIILPTTKALDFTLGLDLQGGAHLVYEADMSGIDEADRSNALESVRDVVERRVNMFGVSEPLVQANKTASGEYRVIAELAGVKDVQEAIDMIGETPILEFKEQNPNANTSFDEEAFKKQIETELARQIESQASSTTSSTTSSEENINEIVLEEGQAEIDLSNFEIPSDMITDDSLSEEEFLNSWISTGLTGKYLKRSSVQFNPNDGSPEVSLEFNDEGAKMFEEITARNIGRPLAIFLDGYPISIPNVNEKITGGQASISGSFSLDEVKTLVKRLNSGALPVPISLIAQKTVEASLGTESIQKSLSAGLIGLILISIFLIIVYRLPGLLSIFSLAVYGLTVLAIFKALPVWLALILIVLIIALIFYIFNELKIFNASLAVLFGVAGLILFFYALQPLTLTVAGIAGFILSLGMAVDANILIFSRVKEELKEGKTVKQSIDDGFRKAWPSIRDGNFSTILTCLILMFFGTSTIQGFGTTLFIGIIVSLFSSIVITRVLMTLTSGNYLDNNKWLLGVANKKSKE